MLRQVRFPTAPAAVYKLLLDLLYVEKIESLVVLRDVFTHFGIEMQHDSFAN